MIYSRGQHRDVRTEKILVVLNYSSVEVSFPGNIGRTNRMKTRKVEGNQVIGNGIFVKGSELFDSKFQFPYSTGFRIKPAF